MTQLPAFASEAHFPLIIGDGATGTCSWCRPTIRSFPDCEVKYTRLIVTLILILPIEERGPHHAPRVKKLGGGADWRPRTPECALPGADSIRENLRSLALRCVGWIEHSPRPRGKPRYTRDVECAGSHSLLR
ncbi:hypothetical protein BN2476_230359 [Paraburkholderia piptadeniae]|uniref:Uncharacterized protein n=1 Tax=Paraburkholderia piptadeniae TaxID=1701573 RepID=A0A1N7RZA1_9BURK|nr:hypothetical protein BN2476_230359 [Paraburkholderia piptadeniae]